MFGHFSVSHCFGVRALELLGKFFSEKKPPNFFNDISIL